MATYLRISEEQEPESEQIAREALLKHLRPQDALLSGVRFHDYREGDIEIDLLVLMPDAGIAVVEVKGGRVSFANGKWWTTGKGDPAQIDPVGQARRGLHALRRFLKDQPEWEWGKLPGDWYLCFPFTDVPEGRDMGPEGQRATIFAQGEEEQLARGIYDMLLSRPGKSLPAADWVQEVIDILQAQGAEPITLEQRVVQRLDAIEELTAEQATMIKVWRSNRFIEVVGGAGSGKTWLAMEQARQWGEAGLSVAFLTYTKGVAEMVKKMFETQPEKQQPTFIGTFHALGYHWGVLPDPERTGDPDYWTYELPPQYADVANGMQPGGKFDAVIVDEAQDFSDGWWDVVLASVKDPEGYRLAIFRDDGQRVFEDRSGRPELPFAVFDLDSNLRNGRRVVEAFAPLSKRKMEIGGGEGLPTRIVLTDADNVIPAADDVVADLVDREGWLPEHVALLTTKSKHSEHALRQDADKDAYWQGLWATDDIFYGTVAGFKGLERPAVVIALNGFHDHADPKDVLYTAISRAIELAVLVGTEEELTEVLGSKHLGKLTRRQEAGAAGGS